MSTLPPVPVFEAAAAPPEALDVDVLIIPVFGAEDRLADVPDLDEAVGGDWQGAVASGEFKYRLYTGVTLRVRSAGWKARHVHVLGAGSPADLDAERWRRLGACAGHLARQRGARSMGFLVRGDSDAASAATMVADGISAAEFDNGTYKRSEDQPGPAAHRVVIAAATAPTAALSAAVMRGRIIGESANFARGLANEPGNVLTPTEFAARVAHAASAVGLSVDILDEDRIRGLGMGLLLAVAQGSAEPPRLMVLRHEPANAPEAPVLALVGKGVTFDSGGISIKPAEAMDRMKDDMSGGAAVAAAMRAIAILDLPVRVLGVIPTVENMPGGRATRPGDVVTGANGTTVEIINTDAEGRLILADALWYAAKLGATHLVDVATLTGAVAVALGRHVTGLYGKPDAWVRAVSAAAARSGDRVWPMPIYEEAILQLRSEIADLSNVGGRPGGASTAAAFLRAFTGDLPWAHLDIAGTAWAEEKTSYQPKGATGVAVRTLIDLARAAAETETSRRA